MNPQRLFEVLKESGVLTNSHKYDVMSAYLEICSFSEFQGLVDTHGYYWDDDINLYKDYDWADYGKEAFEACGNSIDDNLLQFFDFEAYGNYIGYDYAHEYSGGIIEIIH